MSRSVLVLVAVMLALAGGALYWGYRTDAPRPVPASVNAGPAAMAPGPAAIEAPPEAPAATAARTAFRDAASISAWLQSQGHDGPQLMQAWRQWRLSRGLLNRDTLSGVPSDNVALQRYQAMDGPALDREADAGDAGALQQRAGRKLPRDLLGGTADYGAAASAGSAGAMLDLAEMLAAVGETDPAEMAGDPGFADSVQELKGSPDHNLVADAVAWQLAALRQHGPAVMSPELLASLQRRARNLDPGVLQAACGRSLAILADVSAARSRRGEPLDAGPPVFATPAGLYEQLPCRDTAAPVTPPASLARCLSQAGVDADGQPVDLWLCDGSVAPAAASP